MAGTGGKREGAGRKPVADEKKANQIFVEALKKFYHKEDGDDAKKAFVLTLLDSQRGQIFIAEHLFGKPKETVDQNLTLNNFNIKDIFSIDKTES